MTGLEAGDGGEKRPKVVVTAWNCPKCERLFITLNDGGHPKFLHPRHNSRGPAPRGTPAGLATEYSEACEVLAVSPKSAAALARRLLQSILRDPNAGNVQGKSRLVDEINNVENGPPMWSEYLHLVRQLGNVSAHPTVDSAGTILDIEPGEAELMLDVVQALMEHYYTARERLEAAKAAFDNKTSGN